ncbi:YkoP family protein [Virgibacillus ainsalahensis]
MNIKDYCLSAWNIIDPLYYRFTRLQYIEKKSGDKTIMRVRLSRYRGRTVTLLDGTVINKNDLLVKIHLHNVELLRKLQGVDSEIKKALTIYKNVQESLPLVARYIQLQDCAAEIKGLIGITMLNRGSRKLGFEPFPIHNTYYKLFKQAALTPIFFLSSSKASNKEKPPPTYLFMSKNRLFNQYHQM